MNNNNSTTLEEYQNYYEKCILLGGGLNMFGLENCLNDKKIIMSNPTQRKKK